MEKIIAAPKATRMNILLVMAFFYFRMGYMDRNRMLNFTHTVMKAGLRLPLRFLLMIRLR